LADALAAIAGSADDLLALKEALERFAGIQPVKAELVKLRCLAGQAEVEAANAMGVTRATASH
jgi:hypothetical protein